FCDASYIASSFPKLLGANADPLVRREPLCAVKRPLTITSVNCLRFLSKAASIHCPPKPLAKSCFDLQCAEIDQCQPLHCSFRQSNGIPTACTAAPQMRATRPP